MVGRGFGVGPTSIPSIYLLLLCNTISVGSSTASSTTGCTWSSSSLECRLKVLDYRLNNGTSQLMRAEGAQKLRILCTDAFDFESQLRSDHFGALKKLEELEITRCRLRQLPPRAFVGLINLDRLGVHTLNAEWNAAGVDLELDEEAFVGLDNLVTLDLSNSNVQYLPNKVLCPLHNLDMLNLSSNAFSDLDKLNLSQDCQLDRIKALLMDHNMLESLSKHALMPLSKLRQLDLSFNKLSVLAEDTLDTLSHLELLDMSHNALMALPPKLFFATPALRQLRVANNSLGTVDLDAFAKLVDLQILDLSQNSLDENWVKPGLFAGLKSLLMLDLSHNHIAKLEPDLFKDLVQLKVLNLEHNMVHTMASSSFSTTVMLQSLLLSHNRLESVSHQTLNSLSSLQVLDVSHNALHSLHPVLLRNCSSLKQLVLDANLLTQVPEAVHRSSSLQHLHLSHNVIGLLKRESLQKLPNLMTLKLDHNELSRIDEGAFNEATNVLDLDLSGNRFKKLEQETLKALKKLRSLNLADNDLDDINGLLQHQSELKWLNVSNNKLAWFDYAFIPSSLEWLDVSHNLIDGLANYYKLMDDYSLKYIDASHNRIRGLNTFAILPTLELVLLNDNEIESIEDDAFLGKMELKDVNLQGNRLRGLQSRALRISRLKVQPSFRLGSNPLVCSCELEWLKHISSRVHHFPRVLDQNDLHCLVYNHSFVGHRRRLSKVADNEFVCQYEQHCLSDCLCCDFFACDCQMNCPKGCLCLNDNSLNTNVVQCSDRAHTRVPEAIPMDATHLYLDKNNLSTIDSSIFVNRQRLRRLYIRESGLTHLYNNSFEGLDNLISLHLESNLLKRLEGHEFKGLSNLQELYLQRNQLVSIASETFRELKHLRILRLDANLLIDFRVWELSANSRLSYLTLANNWWQCECDFVRNFRMFIDGNVDVVADAADVVCTSANDNNAHHLAVSNHCGQENVDVDLVINTNHSLALIPLLITLIILLIISVAVVIGYRERLLIYLHSRHGIRIVMKEAKTNDPMLFDAFILHSQKDSNIVEALVQHLEPLGFKLCLHYRDLNGLFASETFQPALNMSRRHIVLLSSAFVASEYEQVKDLSLDDALIIVAPDLDIGFVRKTALIKRSRAVLNFGQKRFWPRLKFYLPDPSSSNGNEAIFKKCNNNNTAGGAELDLSGAWTYTSMDNINESVLSSARLINQSGYIRQPMLMGSYPEPPVRKKGSMEPRLSSVVEVAHARSASNELARNNNDVKVEHQRSRSCGLAKVQSFHANSNNSIYNNNSALNLNNSAFKNSNNSILRNSNGNIFNGNVFNHGFVNAPSNAGMSSLAMIPLLRAQHDQTPEPMYNSSNMIKTNNNLSNVYNAANVSRSTSMLCAPARRAAVNRRPRAVGAEDPRAPMHFRIASNNTNNISNNVSIGNSVINGGPSVQHHRSVSSPLTQGFVL